MADRQPVQLATLSEWVRQVAQPLEGSPADFDALMDLVGDARVVLLGEATHGTAEFYATRARITRRLIEQGGFHFVAIEGDWPDALRVDHHVRGGAGTALESLAGFRRFPTWMWRNREVLSFISWLRGFNDRQAPAARVGFYGLDLYSLHASMHEVVRFLEAADPEVAAEVRAHYGCFEPFGADTQQYALSAHFLSHSCEDEVVQALVAFMRQRHVYAQQFTEQATFEAELNAVAVLHAERYYRHMRFGGAVTWNLRDRHMVETLERLLAHAGPRARAIVWEHNSHIGDFRATHEGRSGHVNVGQLARERYGEGVRAVGFGTYQGTVTAAAGWDGPAEYMRVPPAREGSYEAIFHHAGLPACYLDLTQVPTWPPGGWLHESRDERAIGVVYDPAEERSGNYVPSRLARRYDAYCFFDRTLAVEPLDPGPEPPGLETYPSGL